LPVLLRNKKTLGPRRPPSAASSRHAHDQRLSYGSEKKQGELEGSGSLPRVVGQKSLTEEQRGFRCDARKGEGSGKPRWCSTTEKSRALAQNPPPVCCGRGGNSNARIGISGGRSRGGGSKAAISRVVGDVQCSYGNLLNKVPFFGRNRSGPPPFRGETREKGNALISGNREKHHVFLVKERGTICPRGSSPLFEKIVLTGESLFWREPERLSIILLAAIPREAIASFLCLAAHSKKELL